MSDLKKRFEELSDMLSKYQDVVVPRLIKRIQSLEEERNRLLDSLKRQDDELLKILEKFGSVEVTYDKPNNH